jgi:hypothetical protein
MFEQHPPKCVSIGGLVSEFTSLASYSIPYIGIIMGETDEVSRRSATLNVPASVIRAWASRQANLIDRSRFRIPELMRAAYNIICGGGDPGSLPFCLSGSNFVSFEDCKKKISEFRWVDLPMANTYRTNFDLITLDVLSPDYLLSEYGGNVLIVSTERQSNFFDEEKGRQILDEGGLDISEDDLRLRGPAQLLRDVCRELWGNMPEMKVRARTIVLNEYFRKQGASWVLSFIRT